MPDQRMSTQGRAHRFPEFHETISSIKEEVSLRGIQVHGLHFIFRYKRIIMFGYNLIKIRGFPQLVRIHRRSYF